MSDVLNHRLATASPDFDLKDTFRSYLPALLAIGGSVLMVLLRVQLGVDHFMSDGALMMLALACYLTAAVFHLTNLYAPSNWALRLGIWLATAGVFFNFSSWLVRWVNARDHELAILLRNGGETPWFFRYIPFANLYDLSLAFAFGAGITTLLIAHRKSFRFLGAISLPLASLILLLARFIGSEFINLPPVLDSYWRPIHVGIASLSYGVALVCFAIAVVYLLKDGVKTELMAIWSSIFAVAVIGFISNYSVYLEQTYRATAMFVGEDGSRRPTGLRVDVPYIGWALVLTGLLLVGVIIAFVIYLSEKSEAARIWGHRLLKLSLVAQACAIALLVGQVKTMTNIPAHVDQSQYVTFGKWMAGQQDMKPDQIAQIGTAVLEQHASDFLKQSGSRFVLSTNANPVELAALLTAFAGTLFVIIFSFRTARLREILPPLEKLDSLMYKTASVTFAGLVMLLVTGAVWANESWGAYWSWDSKEVGAFVAMLTYAAYLHTRVAHGWSGRRSAYFALVGFILIIFTYLGVSYLLPGLHSYA